MDVKGKIICGCGGGKAVAIMLTTERPESSYGIPVMVVPGVKSALGPADVGPFRLAGKNTMEFLAALRRGGYDGSGR